MSTNNNEHLLQEYFENHYEQHLEKLHRRSTVCGRMMEAFEKSDGSIPDAFYHFLEGEIRLSCAHSAKCVIYMPDFGINKEYNKKGKIIIEIITSDKSWNQIEDCFELQISAKTRLHDVKLYTLKNKDIARYYNIFISWDDALPLVQRVLFCALFRQRFLMTTASRNLGSITTHRFASSIGQVLSFRSCVLKE